MTPLALNQKDAAAALGVSINTFKTSVRPHVKCCYVAGMRRWRPEDLDAWLRRQR